MACRVAVIDGDHADAEYVGRILDAWAQDRQSGVSLAKKIRQENGTIQIVFITGFADYISEGYEVSALHYLMKPVKQEKLFAVGKVKSKYGGIIPAHLQIIAA